MVSQGHNRINGGVFRFGNTQVHCRAYASTVVKTLL